MNFLDVRYRFDDPEQHGLGGALRNSTPASERARSQLLASAIKITPGLFPALGEGLRNLGESMMLQDEVDCFVVANPEMQAYCLPHKTDIYDKFTVVISSSLVERLRIDEIRFVIGHEIGHFLCGHWRYPNEDVAGSFGDRLATLSLMRAAEISADRIGMLACGSLEHACAAMIKVAAGLGEPHLQPDIPSILLQFRELARGDGAESAIWTTHPIIPLRVRALLRFDPICRAISQNETYTEEELKKVDDAIEVDFHKSSGFALQKISDKQLETVRIWGLVSLFAADGVISKAEQYLMVENLGSETAKKVLKFLKSQGSGIHKAVDHKLIDACAAARTTPLSDRIAMLSEFSSIIAQTGIEDHNAQQAFLRIRSLLEP